MKFEELPWQSHPSLAGHRIAKINGLSVLEGQYAYGGLEVMDREGEVHGHLTPDEVLAMVQNG